MSYSRAGEEKTQLQKSTFTLVLLQMALDLKLAQSYVINLLSVIGMHIHSMVTLKGFLNRSFIFSHPRPLMDTLGLAPCQRWNLIGRYKHKILPQTHEHIYTYIVIQCI